MAVETVTGRPDSPTAPMTAAGGEGHETDNASSFDDGVGDKEKLVVLTKWQRLKRHFWRFKWWYLLAGIILLAIILPIIFKVVIPAIVRNVVGSQSLPVKNGTLDFVEPGRLYMALDTELNTPLAVNIDPLGLNLYDPSVDPDAASPFVTLQMPKQHINHKTNVSIASQLIDVQDHAQTVAWFNKFFDQEEAELRIKADKLHAHLGALDYEVGLDKTVKVPGLNYLKGFGVTDVQFVIPPGPDGVNMRGHLTIPNAGVITLGLGNVSFNLMAGDINLGLVQILDLDLKPGNNTPSFTGEFYFDQLVPNLATILDATKDALNKDGNLALTAKGNSTIANGQHIKYIEGVLNTKAIPFTIPAMTFLVDVVSGVLAGGTDGSQSPLFDTLGHVLNNSTLFENLLHHWEEVATEPNGTAPAGTTAKRAAPARATKLGRTIRTNLFRLGLRSLRSKAR